MQIKRQEIMEVRNEQWCESRCSNMSGPVWVLVKSNSGSVQIMNHQRQRQFAKVKWISFICHVVRYRYRGKICFTEVVLTKKKKEKKSSKNQQEPIVTYFALYVIRWISDEKWWWPIYCSAIEFISTHFSYLIWTSIKSENLRMPYVPQILHMVSYNTIPCPSY